MLYPPAMFYCVFIFVSNRQGISQSIQLRSPFVAHGFSFPLSANWSADSHWSCYFSFSTEREVRNWTSTKMATRYTEIDTKWQTKQPEK